MFIVAKRLDGSRWHLVQKIGLGPSHIVLDEDPAPPKGAHPPPIFGPYLLWTNGWMDQDATWYGGRLRPRRIQSRQWVTNCDPRPIIYDP